MQVRCPPDSQRTSQYAKQGSVAESMALHQSVMDLHELNRVAARLIYGNCQAVLCLPKQMVALEMAEWKRMDALKAERNALRSTTIDTATSRLLDSLQSLGQ